MVQKITPVGEGMWLAWAEPDELREQDVNPQIMEPGMFRQLVTNVDRRGVLESVPLCAVPEGGTDVQIVSGHKRIRAAREAGIKRIVILLDESGLSRSAIAAKVLAHNNIHGYADQELMKQLAKEIAEIDDRLEAYLPENMEIDVDEKELGDLLAPGIELDWRTVTLAFVPEALEDFTALIDAVNGQQDLLGACPREHFDLFAAALGKYSRFHDVRNAGAAVSKMIEAGLREIGEGDEDEDEGEDWVSLAAVIGGLRVPPEVAEDVKLAVANVKKQTGLKKYWQVVGHVFSHFMDGAA
jgi:hypothetical protein